MTREEAIRILDPATTVEALAEIEYYAGFSGQTAKVQACNEACEIAVAAMRERDILFEQVRGYCHTCKKNKTDFDCHAKCYGHQRGSAWEWDGGQRLEEV